MLNMENEIITRVMEKVLEGSGFMWGFIIGGCLMLIFRETVVKFIVIKLFKWKNGTKK